MVSKDTHLKESTIFNHNGNKIITEDREINIIARLEEPLVVVLGSVLDDEECDDEYCHTDEEQWSYITHTGLGGNGTYQYTCQQWGEGTGE